MSVGLDPVHFAILMTLNLMIGLLAPPVGMVLHVLGRVASISFERAVTATLPFLVPLIVVLLIATYMPAASLWLTSLIYR